MQSPQLETKGQQNKRIVQQNRKQSPQLRAKVIQRKKQNVKQTPQLESVQSETKSHQIKEMRKQGDMQYQQSGNVQNEHQPDNNKNQLQLVDSSCQDNFVSSSQVIQYPQSEDELKEHQRDNSQYQLQLVDTSHLDNSGDNSAATSHDLQSAQSGNVQSQHCSSKSYPQTDNYKYQPGWLICHARTTLLLLLDICSSHSLGTYRMDISQILTRINLNWLKVHVKTTLLLVICSLHSLGTYRMDIRQIITRINRNWLIVHA